MHRVAEERKLAAMIYRCDMGCINFSHTAYILEKFWKRTKHNLLAKYHNSAYYIFYNALRGI